MDNNEIQLLENIEFRFGFAENNVQFEEMVEKFSRLVLRKLASSYENVRNKAINICNHINKRMTKTVKLPWNSLIEIVCSENLMDSALVKHIIIMYLRMAYERLTEKDKIIYLLPLIKSIELKPANQKTFILQTILEFSQKLNLKFEDLETDKVVDGLYSLYEISRLLSCQEGSLCQSQSLKSKIICYLCKSKLAANIFPSMLHVSFDCLYRTKTNINLQKQGMEFIQWIIRMADTSKLELIKKALLFGLLKIIEETRIKDFDDLIREPEINQALLFKPFYGPLDISICSAEEDNENLKVIIVRFQEFDQFDQWINEENIQAIINILEENIDKSFHMNYCCILKYAFSLFPLHLS
ncbi:ARM repeat-containing protein [Gigaspora margarita]|uniref:ARM repeat-containing protein n=1 Tax=Gigaspora margarita TaxID=4874 RepID=A0A8H4EQS1_GIGMA|nr:ARM repeat-containing protein [Gigaspora margarita]